MNDMMNVIEISMVNASVNVFMVGITGIATQIYTVLV